MAGSRTVSPSLITIINSKMPTAYSKDWFETNRKTVVDFCKKVFDAIKRGKRHILIKAPVKSGKRVIMEYLSLLLREFGFRVKYITSLNRVDVKNQQDELELYHINTHLTKDDRSVSQAMLEIEHDITNGFKVVAGFDECDYGSGDKQKLGTLYKKFRDNADVVKLYISATAHETEASTLCDREDFESFTYDPPEGYCGAKFFLDNNLVFEPQEFFELDEFDGNLRLTEHGKQVLQDSVTKDRTIGVVRTPRKVPTVLFVPKLIRKALELQLEAVTGKEWEIVVVDQSHPLNWEDHRTRNGFIYDPKRCYLIIIMQTCTRGTDLKGWHHKLAFWHDQRVCDGVNLNTLLQAIRVCHFAGDYPGGVFEGTGEPTPQKVRVYMDQRIIKMAADDNLDEYLAAGGKVPTRTKKGRRPGSSAVGWGVPIPVTLPHELYAEMFLSKMTDRLRTRWTEAIMDLLDEETRARFNFDDRTLSTKRSADDGVRQVHQKYLESVPCQANPGGTMTEEIFESRENHFWLDFATRDIPLANGQSIPKYTAYITYGVEIPSEASSPASSPIRIYATPASMYANTVSETTIPTLPPSPPQ